MDLVSSRRAWRRTTFDSRGRKRGQWPPWLRKQNTASASNACRGPRSTESGGGKERKCQVGLVAPGFLHDRVGYSSYSHGQHFTPISRAMTSKLFSHSLLSYAPCTFQYLRLGHCAACLELILKTSLTSLTHSKHISILILDNGRPSHTV